MGNQIIKQPDGKFSMFSGATDTFIALDCEAEELVSFIGDEAKRVAEEAARTIINQLNAGQRPYYQFTKTWLDAYATYRRAHGKSKEADEFGQRIEELAGQAKGQL